MKTNINKIIKDWIGEEETISEHLKIISPEAHAFAEGGNQALSDLRSRIPELSEQLTTEIYSSLLSRFDNDVWDIEGTREVDGKDFISPEQLKRIREILFTELTSKE